MKVKYFIKDKKKHGRYEFWFNSGETQKEMVYVDGVLEGEYKEWTFDGKFIVHRYYEKGKVIKTYK
jgi:antitoxin component YwqK of YwqJK toxin-antitoxin module